MMRIEFLQFLSFQDIVKISLLNKACQIFVDPNRQYVETDSEGRVTKTLSDHKLEYHLMTIATIHEAHREMIESKTRHEQI